MSYFRQQIITLFSAYGLNMLVLIYSFIVVYMFVVGFSPHFQICILKHMKNMVLLKVPANI